MQTPCPVGSHPPFLLFFIPWKPLICFMILWIYLLWIFHIHGITQYVTFYDWLLSFSVMFLRFTHIVACITLFSPSYDWMIFHCTRQIYHNLFTRSSVDGHLGSFHLLAIVNNHICKLRPQVSHTEGGVWDKEGSWEEPSSVSSRALFDLSDWPFTGSVEGWVSLGVRFGTGVHLALRSVLNQYTPSPDHTLWI